MDLFNIPNKFHESYSKFQSFVNETRDMFYPSNFIFTFVRIALFKSFICCFLLNKVLTWFTPLVEHQSH
jgi:hypothetical protein